MKTLIVVLVGVFVCASCRSHDTPSHSLTPAQAAEVDAGVRAFAKSVAQDVTERGPSAWRTHFSDSPAFFMASEGHLAFPDSASATAGIKDLARVIKHIDLKWGNDLRVDPLSPDLAIMASTWHEVLVSPAGVRNEQTGFFTGTAEYSNGRWLFRNAHWSVQPPPQPRPESPNK